MPEETKIQTSAGLETPTETVTRINQTLSGDIPVTALEQPIPEMVLPEVNVPAAPVASTLTATQRFLGEQQAAAQQAAAQEAGQTATVRALQQQVLGRGQEQLGLEQDAGLFDQRKQLADLMTNIQSRTEDLASFDDDTFLGEEALRGEAAGRDITKGTFSARARERRLQRAIDRTGQAAKLRASVASAQLLQNNITAAQDEINRAMELKYGVIEQALEFEKDFLNRAFQQADTSQKNLLNARMMQVERQEQAVDDAKQLVEAAALSGANPQDVEELFDIDDPEEQADQARLLISQMAAQDRAFEIEARQIERAVAYEQLRKLREKPEIQRNTAVIDQGGRKLLIDENTGEVIRDFGVLDTTGVDELAFAVDTEKINAIDELKSHKGLSMTVGPNALARSAILSPIGSKALGQDDAFIGAIDQLTKSLTIDNLAEAKDRGATFGALSDTEIRLLADSATKINSWRRTDGEGNTKDFDVREKDFIEELDKISNYKKLDTYLKGVKSGYWNTVDPATIGIEVQPDGSVWAQNGDGTITKLR